MSCDGLVVETTGGWGGGEGGEGGEDRGEEVEEEKKEEVEAGDWDKLPNRWQRRRGRNSLSLLCRLLSSLSLLSPPSHHTGQSVLSFFHQSQCSLTIVPLVQWTLPGCDISFLLLCSFTFSVSNINLPDKYEVSIAFCNVSNSQISNLENVKWLQTSYSKSLARLSQTYREHCLVRRRCQ